MKKLKEISDEQFVFYLIERINGIKHFNESFLDSIIEIIKNEDNVTYKNKENVIKIFRSVWNELDKIY